MAQLKFGSAGVTAREIDISGPVEREPTGIPAGIIGTSLRGPAFVPITVGLINDFYAKFGRTDGKKFGPLAVAEWLRNAGSVTYLRVMGAGDGRKRADDGSVANAGFTVGELQPRVVDGALVGNEYANSGSNSVLGRTYVLGAFMSESAGSVVFSDAGLQGAGGITPDISSSIPIVRGILMAPSGVIMRLSSSITSSDRPASTLVATEQSSQGNVFGAVNLLQEGTAKQDFVLLLNGHRGTDALYPNVITASFDMTSPNYFANVLNRDPYKYQQAGHYLYAAWDIHPSTAVVTGSGIVSVLSGASALTAQKAGSEIAAFITTSSLARNVGSDTVPNFEAWTDRYGHAKTPWIISQKFGGAATNLFRVHALDAGAGISTGYKISIENLVPSTDPTNRYGSFDLVVRDWNDNDGDVRALEQWRGVNLDPNSDRYIAKVIGDAHIFYNFDAVEASQKLIVDGSYTNRSNLIRIEVSTDVDNQYADPTALPMGFRGIEHLVTSGTMPMTTTGSAALDTALSLKRTVEPPLPLRKNITQGSGAKLSVNPLLYWGARFEHITSLTTPNASTLRDASMQSFAKYFPNFATTVMPVVVGDNAGAVATAENGIVDSDAFCRNTFTLENVKVVTGSTTLADPAKWDSATYVRDGNITADETAKTRRLSVSDAIQANRRFMKYSLLLQGGFNGVNLFDRDEEAINNNAVVADMNDTDRGLQDGPSVRAYVKALDIMKNVTNVDIQLLAIPGIREPTVTDAGINAVEDRFDALYIMDIEQHDNTDANVIGDDQLPSVTLTVDDFRNRALDSSFTAAYFPDVLIQDPTTRTNLFAPPSVVVLGALALNDAVGHPWFAPAGLARGALASALEARVKLSKTNMDALYDVSINPLVAFPGNATSGTNPKGGVTVWGQKTLQVAASALDRVNVRRLLIDIRRTVRGIAQTILFEPNREATLARFTAAIKPRLDRIQALNGLERFEIIIDTSTTTQADVENNTIRGKIYVQPTKVAEFVGLDFVVTNNVEQTL